MATQDEYQARRISWGWVLAWTGLGVVLLCAAGILQGAWIWTGVSIDILVHVGGTLLLAPLLPFLERSLTRRVVQETRAWFAGDGPRPAASGLAGHPYRPAAGDCRRAGC